METKLLDAARREGLTHPSWSTALLFPNEGQWSEGDYLALPTNRLVELSEGSLEVLSLPTRSHQAIVFFLGTALKGFLAGAGGGEVVVAPYPVRLWPGKIREPDVVCLLAEHASQCMEKYSDGADLVMEVVSGDDPGRDKETKRNEYARARIAEYWIVDPAEASILVLALVGDEYVVHGQFHRGEHAASRLLAGFAVEVGEALAGR